MPQRASESLAGARFRARQGRPPQQQRQAPMPPVGWMSTTLHWTRPTLKSLPLKWSATFLGTFFAVLTTMLLVGSIGWYVGTPKLAEHPCAAPTTVFNRQAEARALKTLIEDKHPLLTITGPRGSGKSTLIPSVLRELSDAVFCFDLRMEDVHNYESLIELFDRQALKFAKWAEVFHRDSSVRASLSEVLGTAPAIAEPYLEMTLALVDKGHGGLHGIIERLEKAIERHHAKTGNVTYIFINELQIALGDSFLPAKDRAEMKSFVNWLERMLLEVSREKGFAVVVQVTSEAATQDQMLTHALTTRRLSEVETLGYMAKEEVLRYLAEEAKIDDAALREEIYQQVGGDFRELRSAGGHFHAGGAERVRGALARSLVIVKKNYEDSVATLDEKDRDRFARFSGALLQKPQPVRATQDLYGSAFVARIIQAGLVQVRQRATAPELQPDVWEAPDEEVLTFLSPIHEAAARALGPLYARQAAA